ALEDGWACLSRPRPRVSSAAISLRRRALSPASPAPPRPMPLRSYALALLFVVPAAAPALVGCSGATGVVADSAEEAYNNGMNAFADGRYDRAIEYLTATLDFGRAGEWADEAQIYLARAYFETGQYLLAAAEFDRFGDLYPNDPRTEEARLGEIQSYYRLSPPYDLDQTDTDRAIVLIRTF